MEATSGILNLKICSAILTRDTELIGKMDPFVKIIYNNKERKTNVKNEAGTTPIWNQSWKFHVNSEEMIKFDVADEDTFSND